MRSIGWAIGVTLVFVVVPDVLARSQVVTEDAFSVLRLPPGKDVTLSGGTSTLIPPEVQVKLSATGNPQTISFTASKSLKVRVQDDKIPDKIKVLRIKPHRHTLYQFPELGSIIVTATGTKMAEKDFLEVRSDRPLTIAR